jgi:hypothetical protein
MFAILFVICDIAISLTGAARGALAPCTRPLAARVLAAAASTCGPARLTAMIFVGACGGAAASDLTERRSA